MRYTIVTRNWFITYQGENIIFSRLKDYTEEGFSNSDPVCQEIIEGKANELSLWNKAEENRVKTLIDQGNFDFLNDTVSQKLLTDVKP
mgnify:FL=1